MSLAIQETERGFGFGKFTDAKGNLCKMQESCRMGEPAIWFGIIDVNPRIKVGDVWQSLKPPFPEREYGDTLFNDMVYLKQDLAKQLLKDMIDFCEGKVVKTRNFTDSSSLFTECCVRVVDNLLEIGPIDANPQYCCRGWKPLVYPEGTVFTTHASLNPEIISGLQPDLERFIEHGYLRPEMVET